MDQLQRRIPLNGDDWQLKGYIGEDWRWRDAHLTQTRDPHNWIAATVPGSVHHDLWQAGLIADPYREQNTLLSEWVSARTWIYRKRFSVDETLRGRRVQLCFEGVDYEASFYLNGEPLGHHCSMFTPAHFDVGHLLNYRAENILAVVLQPAPHEQPQVGRSSLVRTHKTRMNYWWDFCPRLVHLGLWDDVTLNVTGPVRIENVFVRPQLNEDFSQATVEVSVTLSGVSDQMITLEIAIDDTTIHQETRHLMPAGSGSFSARLELQHPELWWPNGYGEQRLYDLDLRVIVDPDGETSDCQCVSFGVRQVAFLPNEGAPEGARPYTLAVNGRKIYIKGWNWVPMDLLYGVEMPRKRARLLSLVQRAHANVLRVWGGGLIEKEAFYDLCDRLGILVWQEFIQSSSGIENVPPGDLEYALTMQEEAQQIVPRRRNHPSLLLWCGGNELQDAEGRPQDDEHPLLNTLKGIVNLYDPDRHWLPTSPTGPCFGNTLQNIEEDPDSLHDVHGPWIYEGLDDQYRLFNASTSLLNSEFGVEGITNLRTLNDVMPLQRQRPIRRANPIWHHLGAWWIWEEHWDDFWGGLVQRDTPQVVRAVQFLQAEGLRYAIEANRRRKYHNSGSLPWQFNEPYPMAACTSVVDYYARPKPAYHAVTRAYASLLVSARYERIAWAGAEKFQATVWTSYSGEQDLPGLTLCARLVTATGDVCAQISQPATVPGNASQAQAVLEASLEALRSEVFFLDLILQGEDGTVLARNRYPFSRGETLSPLLDLPAPDLEVCTERSGDRWQVTIANNGACAAPGVWLDVAREVRAPGYAYFEDNFMHLLPGERRAIAVVWDGIAQGERALGVQALTGEERIIHG